MCVCLCVYALPAQVPTGPPALPEDLVKRLPVRYQEEARKVSALPDGMKDFWIDYYRSLPDEEWRGEAFALLAQKLEGAEFLEAQLDAEPSGDMRAQIVVSLEQYFAQHPQHQSVLEKRVSSDPDPTAALVALDTLRRIKESGLRKLLENRIKAAQGSDENVVKKLREVYLADYAWYGHIRLPEFAYKPPPPFQLKPARRFVRVVAFGDFADPYGAQAKTAAAMRAYHHEHPFDFGITLGDNFYGMGPLEFADREGLSSPYDPRWQTQWEQLYGPMGIKFYPSFGNADYVHPDGPAAELAYSKMSKTWAFPAPYYTYVAGSVQFFAIDNIRLSDAELQWLDDELAKSKARWKVVYGHYHIYSGLGIEDDNRELISRLLPILKKNSVDVWLSGHLHGLQELQPEGALHFFVSAGGGAPVPGEAPADKRSKFREAQHGFSVIEANDNHFEMIFVNDGGKELYRSHITK